MLGLVVGQVNESSELGDPPRRSVGVKSGLRFYEKVIKVKADVAALHIFFSDIDDAASGGVESCQGRRF